MNDPRLIADQLTYYRERASEYDEWFFREGRYDRGPAHRAEWFREMATIEAALLPALCGKKVLELAAGTGLWTKRLLDAGARVTAVDASSEAITLNRSRVQDSEVSYEIADIFCWRPCVKFDVVFFSFWLSHVSPHLFARFWGTLRDALLPTGSALFIDSLLEQTSTAKDNTLLNRSGIAWRKLNDGREFRIVKVFYEPQKLARDLVSLGWSGSVQWSGKFFLYGSMRPTGMSRR